MKSSSNDAERPPDDVQSPPNDTEEQPDDVQSLSNDTEAPSGDIIAPPHIEHVFYNAVRRVRRYICSVIVFRFFLVVCS